MANPNRKKKPTKTTQSKSTTQKAKTPSETSSATSKKAATSEGQDALQEVIKENVAVATTGAKAVSSSNSPSPTQTKPTPSPTPETPAAAKAAESKPEKESDAPVTTSKQIAKEPTSQETDTMKESDSDKKSSTTPTPAPAEVSQHEVDTIPVGPILIIAGFLFIWAAGYVQNRISNDKQYNRIKAIETRLEEKVSSENLEAVQGRASTAESKATEAMKSASDTKKELSSVKSTLSKKADAADLESGLASKADSDALSTVSENVAAVQAALNTKVSTEALTSVQDALSNKSSSVDLDALAAKMAAKADMEWVKESMTGVVKSTDLESGMTALKSDVSSAQKGMNDRLQALEAALAELKATLNKAEEAAAPQP